MSRTSKHFGNFQLLVSNYHRRFRNKSKAGNTYFSDALLFASLTRVRPCEICPATRQQEPNVGVRFGSVRVCLVRLVDSAIGNGGAIWLHRHNGIASRHYLCSDPSSPGARVGRAASGVRTRSLVGLPAMADVLLWVSPQC